MPDKDVVRASLVPEGLPPHEAPFLLTEEKPKKVERLKTRLVTAGQKAGSLGRRAVEKYTPKRIIPKEFLKKYKPYIEKAVLMVAVAAASEVLNDREKMEAVYMWVLKLVPSSVRLFLPEKLLFNTLWYVKDDVIRKIQDYREKITSSNRSEEEIQRLTDEADQSIKEMDKTL